MLCLLWQGGGGARLPWSMLPVVALIGLCIGSYTYIDGQALRRWSHPLDYLVWVTLLSAWPFPLLAWVRKRPAFMLFWREQWRLGLAVGFCVLFSYALVLWAMQLGSIAEAAALREISVILVVLFGMRYLKEPFGGPRLLSLWPGADWHAGDEILITPMQWVFYNLKEGRRYDGGSVVRLDRDFPAVRVYGRGQGQWRVQAQRQS